jgi:hypothetical protein
MARARSSPTTPARASSRPVGRRSAIVTGIAGGSGLAALAQNLPEPYKKTLSLCAPFISVMVTSLGPIALDVIVAFGHHCSQFAKHHYAIHRLKGYLKRQRKRLETPGLPPELRASIEGKIARAEESIDNHEYEWVSPFLRGDSVSGVQPTTGSEEREKGNAPPPEAQEPPS